LNPILSVVTVSSKDVERFMATRKSLAPLDEKFEHVVVVPRNQTADYSHSIDISEEIHGMSTRVVLDEGVGIYEAMNLGAKSASGEFICFWNSGDTLHSSDDAKHIVDSLESSEVAWGLFQGEIDWYPNYRVTDTSLAKFVQFQGGFVSHQTVFVRKDIFIALGGFDTKYRIAADTDQIIKLWKSFEYLISQDKLVRVEKPNFAVANYKQTRSEIIRIIFRRYEGVDRILTFFRYLFQLGFEWLSAKRSRISRNKNATIG